MKNKKIKLLNNIMWLWDVFFTLVDNWQLARYMWLRRKLDELYMEDK